MASRKAAGAKILEETVAQCLKAAVLGKELGQLINRYDKLDLDQINTLIPRILSSAAAITGRDYSALQSRTTSIISEIREDPLWRDAANSVLDRVNNAAAKRIQTQSALVNSTPGGNLCLIVIQHFYKQRPLS